MTSSEDGTVRIWDCTEVVQKTVIKPQLAKPVRTAVTTCSYSSDGNLIAAGLMDGSIQLWSTTGKFGSSAAVGQVGGLQSFTGHMDVMVALVHVALP